MVAQTMGFGTSGIQLRCEGTILNHIKSHWIDVNPGALKIGMIVSGTSQTGCLICGALLKTTTGNPATDPGVQKARRRQSRRREPRIVRGLRAMFFPDFHVRGHLEVVKSFADRITETETRLRDK